MMGAGLCWLAVAYASLPGADEEQEPGPALVWSSRVQQYLLRDLPLLPDQAWRAESLLAGEWVGESWYGSGYLDLQHQWLGSLDQDASTAKLGKLYWHPMLGEQDQLQIGKLTLDLDPSYTTHPAGFFQAASTPFDDFLPDVGVPMVTLTHWFTEEWRGHLVAATQGNDPLYGDEAQWGAVVQVQQEAWLWTGLLQKYQSSSTAAGATFVYEGDSPFSWHGSLAGRGQGDEKVNAMFGGMWQGENQSVMAEYGYDRSSLTNRQLWQMITGEDGAWLSRFPQSEQRRTREHQSLFAQYNWESSQRQILLAGMVEADGSAISQLRHTWLISEPFNCWLEGQRTFGSASSTYGALPWRWQWQLGFRWQFV